MLDKPEQIGHGEFQKLTAGSDFVLHLHNDWSDVLAFADQFIFARKNSNNLKIITKGTDRKKSGRQR